MMKSLFNKASLVFAGSVLALAVGSPAIADDTELLLISPNQANLPKPNILLILDSSGSMDTEENTREVYDSTQNYTGDCDQNRLYWTEVSAVPSCDSGNTKFIDDSAYVCVASNLRMAGIGRYTDIMVQYRDDATGGGSTTTQWQLLEPGNNTDSVECRRDSGNHGDGSANDVYARKGGNVPQFTSDKTQEIPWGSWPTSQEITVYDGNYLNYRANPVFVDKERIDIVKDVAQVVLNSIENVNVGVMRFNDNEGGPVILGMTDLNTNRASILSTIDGLGADGATPLSETLYEAARYWRGMAAYYGENVDEHPTDPAALDTTVPEDYKQPDTQVCAKNFNVLLTDGDPNEDDETPSLVDNLPDWAAIVGAAGCDGSEEGRCLDDIANYLYNADISTDPGPQNVTTHTIGFSINLPILQQAADESNGTYYQADDVDSLAIALLDIASNIEDRSLSFAAPAVAVNTFNRTQNLNDLYLTTFAARESMRWPGNLKKYRLSGGEILDKADKPAVNPADGFFFNNATSIWSTLADGNDVEKGGAVENMPNSSSRKLYTNNTSNNDLTTATNAMSTSNSGNFSLADFGLTGSAMEPSIDNLIDWARGVDVRDEDNDPATTERQFMGDPLHSQPAAVIYGGTAANPEGVIYTATNHGYLHAIDSQTGVELWSFVPKELLPNLVQLYFDQDTQFKNYGIDGDVVPVVKDVDGDGVVDSGDGDFVYIIFGMRRGGGAYYALDVTNRTAPKLKWRVGASGFGQTWSRPTVVRVDLDDNSLNADKAVVVLGGGYDPAHDSIAHPATADDSGNGIYFLDLETGAVLWRAGRDNGANLTIAGMTRSFPSQIQAIDLNGDRFADRMYAADVAGQLWRFDIFAGNQPTGTGANALVTGGVVAQLGAEGNTPTTDAETRRFYNAPDIALINDNALSRRFITINIGSGYRAHPLDNTNNDRFFSVRDRNVFNSLSQSDYDTFTIVKDADLIEVSGSIGTSLGLSDAGWKFTLPANQKVLANSATFNNVLFFVAFSPDNATAATCAAGRGENFLYSVSVVNGDPLGDLDNIVAGEEDDARVSPLAQGGIAPGARFLFPTSDDPDCEGAECKEPPVACVGTHCWLPEDDPDPIRTLWTQDGVN